jgi:hypothetical protein
MRIVPPERSPARWWLISWRSIAGSGRLCRPKTKAAPPPKAATTTRKTKDSTARRLPGSALSRLGKGEPISGDFLRIVSGLAANTHSIFCDGESRRQPIEVWSCEGRITAARHRCGRGIEWICFDALLRRASGKVCALLTIDLHRSRPTGMYGPPPGCQRKRRVTGWVYANGYGLWWRKILRARRECAALSSHFSEQSWQAFFRVRVHRAPDRPLCHLLVHEQTGQEWMISSVLAGRLGEGVARRFPTLTFIQHAQPTSPAEAGASTGDRYRSPVVRTAQAMRASLLASATPATWW